MTDKLNGDWTSLSATERVAVQDRGTGREMHPLVWLDYRARAKDPVAFELFAGAMTGDDVATWIGKILLQVGKTVIEARPVADACSGACPLADELTPLVNAELAASGIEVAIATFDVSMAPEDADPQGAAMLAAAELMMSGKLPE